MSKSSDPLLQRESDRRLQYWPALGIFLLTFPTERFVPRWSLIFVILWITNIFAFLLAPPFIVALASVAVTFGGTLFTLVYRYRKVFNATERQQTKWLVFALVLSFAMEVGVAIARSIVPGLNRPDSIFALTDVLFSGLLWIQWRSSSRHY